MYVDPILAEVIDSWADLPSEIKNTISTIIKSTVASDVKTTMFEVATQARKLEHTTANLK